MKKILLSLSAVMTVFMASAQADTITEFFTGTPTYYVSAGGYVNGTNEYGDLGKYMRFDAATMGLPTSGGITGVLLAMPTKNDNGGSFDVVVRDFNGGTPGAALASSTVTIASVDTTVAGYAVAENAVVYNVAVTFANPVMLNASSDLLVGITVPTTAGDSVNLISNTDGDFTNSANYTWEEWSDNSLVSFADANGWGLDVALAIYPIVNASAGINEGTLTANVYPNPATSELNVVVNGDAKSVSVISMDGKVLVNQAISGGTAKVDVSSLTTGVYVYEVVANDGTVLRDTFVKK